MRANTDADPEYVTLHALDRLSPGEAAAAEAAIAEDSELAQQLREVEEIAAHVWHASSPLHSAPAEIWDHIESEIQGSSRISARTVLLALGWAAALTLLLVLIFQDRTPSSEPTLVQPSQPIKDRGEPGPSTLPPRSPTKSPIPERASTPKERQLRAQLQNLRDRLAKLERGSPNNPSQPTIIALHPPGADTTPNPKADNSHVVSLITAALSRDLQREKEEPVDLVIEQGWDPSLFREVRADKLIRHRTFLQATEDLDLKLANDGRFYDASSGFIWTPATDGASFLGQLGSADEDLSVFLQQPEKSEELVAVAPDAPRPSGYIIQDPVTNESTLIVDELPEQPEGGELLAVISHSDGTNEQIPLTPPSGPDMDTTGFFALGPGFGGDATLEFSHILPDGTSRVLLSTGTNSPADN